MKISLPVFGAVALLIWLGAALAADIKPAELKKRLQTLLPELAVEELKPSPVAGIYEGVVGSQIVYVTTDGRYLFVGTLHEINGRRNLTQASRAVVLNRLIEGIGEANMIVMGPSKPKRTITVFTDVDCPYCARLHLEVPRLNEGGVKVRYLLYPRAGLGSETYRRSVAVWCAKDRVEAVGIAKAGGQIEMKTCDNPVDRHYALGQELGIEGTPTILTDRGEIFPGFLPAAQLLSRLGLEESADPAKVP